jgi:hypothetical protein
MLSARYSSQILIKLEFSQQVFENSSNIEFCEIRPVRAEMSMRKDRHDEANSRFSEFFECD